MTIYITFKSIVQSVLKRFSVFMTNAVEIKWGIHMISCQ